MIRLAVLPDEFGLGFRGRVFQANCWNSTKQGVTNLLAWIGRPGANLRDTTVAETLAQVAEISSKQFLRDHSLLALSIAINRKQHVCSTAWEDQRARHYASAFRSFKPGAYFCRSCVAEDMAFHGFSYWRREHQVPGRFTCSKHQIGLSVERGLKAYETSPSHSIHSAQVVAHEWLKVNTRSEAVQRFLSICDYFLTLEHSIDELNVARLVNAAAKSHERALGTTSSDRHLLSDRALCMFPGGWLKAVMPSLTTEKRNGEYWAPLDSAVSAKRSATSVMAYAMTLAILYPNAVEACNAFTQACRERPSIRRAYERTPTLDRQSLKESYIRHRGSHSKVAADLRASPTNVTAALYELGLPRIGGRNLDRLAAVMERVLSGQMTLEQACITNGISLSTGRGTLEVALYPLHQALAAIQPTRRARRTVSSREAPAMPSTRDCGVGLAETIAYPGFAHS